MLCFGVIKWVFQSTPSVKRETAKLHTNRSLIPCCLYSFDNIGLFIYPHKPKKEPSVHDRLYKTGANVL